MMAPEESDRQALAGLGALAVESVDKRVASCGKAWDDDDRIKLSTRYPQALQSFQKALQAGNFALKTTRYGTYQQQNGTPSTTRF